MSEETRRAQFATQTARAEFGRFYWNDELAERMKREEVKSRAIKRAAKEARRHRRNSANG